MVQGLSWLWCWVFYSYFSLLVVFGVVQDVGWHSCHHVGYHHVPPGVGGGDAALTLGLEVLHVSPGGGGGDAALPPGWTPPQTGALVHALPGVGR